MEYTICRLAELAGVTTRTLRWYDRIGLLRPSGRGENGYRLYGAAEVDRLQQILFYRALGVELEQIKTILDDPAFDSMAALREHLRALRARQAQLEELIRTVTETIRAKERRETMCDEAKFAAFRRREVEKHEARYGAEARKQYGGEAVDAANARWLDMTREEYEAYAALEEEIRARLERAVQAGMDPEGEEGRELAALHGRWLKCSLGERYTPEIHRGIVQVYTADQRFQAYYDRTCPGCARFLQRAVLFWIS